MSPQSADFKWRDVYLMFVQRFDPDATDPRTPTVRLQRPWGQLVVSEGKALDPRETNGRREFVKIILKSPSGLVVLTTTEGHEVGSIHYL